MTDAPIPRLPNPLTPEALDTLMRERAYWDLNHPRSRLYRRLVQRGFEILYPGEVRYGARGTVREEPLPPGEVAHLVVDANREMEQLERAIAGPGPGPSAA